MNDKELADACVELGVAEPQKDLGTRWYRLNNRTMSMGLQPIHFVRDWRVAGALMEKFTFLALISVIMPKAMHLFEGTESDMSFPRAIIEACVSTQSTGGSSNG